MIEYTNCLECVHDQVCGKKADYSKWVYALTHSSCTMSDKSVSMNDPDVIISMKCAHYLKNVLTDKMFVSS